MKKFLQRLAFILLCLPRLLPASGQDLSGYWQGMDFGPRPSDVTFWPTTLELTQNGKTISGSCFQQITSQTPYYVVWKVQNASVNMNVGEMVFSEITAMDVAVPAELCFSKYSFTYYPDEERLLGKREFDCGMTLIMDLYRLRLKTRDTYCEGEIVMLEVTGKDVRWYSDPQKMQRLHSGNTYETRAMSTDTFYVTQTFHDVETPPVPVILKVSKPVVTDVQVTHASCDKDNGVISVTATGDGPMAYNLDNDPPQSSPVFPSLYAKTFNLTVRTATGCIVRQEVKVEKKSYPSFLQVVAERSCTSEYGTIYATAQGGYGPLSYTLDNQPFGESGNFSDLQTGEYLLRARDSVGCETSMKVRVPDKSDAVVLQDIEVDHAKCGAEFGAVTVIATGKGDLQYSLDGTEYTSSPSFLNVLPAAYDVHVKDPAGCMANKKIVVGKSPAPEFLHIIERNASCSGSDGSISILARGSGPLLFSLDGINFVSDTVFNGLSPLNQSVNMLDTAGCYVTRSILIAENCIENVSIPTAFTPDTDGKNEVMDLKFSGNQLKIRHFRLFNRWGIVAAFSDKTVESGYALWDGFYKGTKVQPGSYPYELMVEFENGRTQVIKNSIMLLR